MDQCEASSTMSTVKAVDDDVIDSDDKQTAANSGCGGGGVMTTDDDDDTAWTQSELDELHQIYSEHEMTCCGDDDDAALSDDVIRRRLESVGITKDFKAVSLVICVHIKISFSIR